MSTSLYNTFGNEVSTRINQQTIERYLKDATIKFVLPEATSSLLADLGTGDNSVDKPLRDAVISKLENLGFAPANAKAMASVLLPVAKQQGVSPLDYFDNSDAALKLAVDTYNALNILRPPGNRIGLTTVKQVNRTSVQQLLRP
jgi:hypothetical protein